jgi:site-specific recombinase XerD
VTEESPLGRDVSPAAMVDAVLAHDVSRETIAPSTITEFGDVMRRFVVFIERGLGLSQLSQIGAAEVESFVRSRRADGGRPSLSLMHNRRTVCRHLFRTAMALGITSSDPTIAIDLPLRGTNQLRALTSDEVTVCRSVAMFHQADLPHPLAWTMAEATARTIEIAHVRVRDVDVTRGLVHLPGSPRTDPRTVPLTDWGLAQARRRVLHHDSDPDAPFVPFRSRKVPRASASMAVIEVIRAAGLSGPGVRPVSVVAWRGTQAYRAGSSIQDVAVLLGMRSLDRTAALIGVLSGQARP